MSLKIWLPLNGDYHNQGLNKYNITTIGTISWPTTGKIGKCFQGGNGTQISNGLYINSNLTDLLRADYSIAVWVKPLGTHVHYNGTIISSGNWNGKAWAFGVSQDNSKVDVLAYKYNTYLGCSVPVNIWTHLVCVRQNNIIKLYKNGQFISSLTGSSAQAILQSDATYTAIGRQTYAGGYFSFNGCINDLRIYDHALSQQQIKKISQGLILHYPFNNKGFGQPNFIRNSKNQRSIKNGVMDYLIVTSDWSQLKGNIVTFSADMKSSVDGPVKCDIYFRTSSNMVGNSCAVTGITGSYKKIVVTFMAPSSNETVQYFYVRCNANAGANPSATYFCKNVKVELGNKATPWIPHRLDTQYSSYQLNNNKIIDISGFGNNGLITGTYTVEAGSPVYKNALYANYLNTNYHVESIELPILDAISVSFWIKTEKASTGKVVFIDNVNGIECVISNSGIHVRTVSSAGFPSTLFISNTWHHIVIIKNNTNYKLFLNGIEIARNATNNNWIHNSNNLWLLNRDSNNNYAFKGTICDFRIYCTALTSDDVKELYEYHPEQTIEEESQE